MKTETATKIDVLYEDRDMIACVKPAGILSAPVLGDDASLPELLSSVGVDLPITQTRLDRGVGGVVLLSKNSKAAAKISALLADHEACVKEYLAVVHGHPPREEIWEDLLYHDSAKNKTFPVKRMRRGVRDAKLSYCVLGETADFSLVHVRLYTGRTHQIRVQFASRKYPLVGDGKYGSKSNRCCVALFSHRLSFPHPTSGEPMVFTAMPPKEYPWNLFIEEN